MDSLIQCSRKMGSPVVCFVLFLFGFSTATYFVVRLTNSRDYVMDRDSDASNISACVCAFVFTQLVASAPPPLFLSFRFGSGRAWLAAGPDSCEWEGDRTEKCNPKHMGVSKDFSKVGQKLRHRVDYK